MGRTIKASEVKNIGTHSSGYKIDKTVSPLDRYTKWEISDKGEWKNPKPVCFDSMPQTGWVEV